MRVRGPGEALRRASREAANAPCAAMPDGHGVRAASRALPDFRRGRQRLNQPAADDHRLQHRLRPAGAFIVQPEQIVLRIAEELLGAGQACVCPGCSWPCTASRRRARFRPACRSRPSKARRRKWPVPCRRRTHRSGAPAATMSAIFDSSRSPLAMILASRKPASSRMRRTSRDKRSKSPLSIRTPQSGLPSRAAVRAPSIGS